MSDYPYIDDIDFSLITMGWRKLALLEDDLYLGMQGMNVGITDTVITQWEYSLLQEYIEIEKTPLDSALRVSAFSQMWVFAVYEVMRLWRERVRKYSRWYSNGGIEQLIANLSDDNTMNMSIKTRKANLERYHDDAEFRDRSEQEWQLFQPIFEGVELLRINIAKHAAPGKESVVPRAPGYGRINMMCGAMDYEVINKDNIYTIINRRDIAEHLRSLFGIITTQEKKK